MKTVILSFIIIVLSLGMNATGTVSNQSLPVYQTSISAITFSFVRGTQTGNGYNLQWKLSSYTGVKSFIVESTYEDPTDPYSVWQTKGVVTLANGINKFSDHNLLPGIINYRITVVANDNSTLAVSDIFTDVIQ